MYKLCFDRLNNTIANCVKRTEDGALIPFDPANTDYQKYLQWLSEGNEPLPPDEVTE